MKSKLGVSVGVLGAVTYMLVLTGFDLVALLLVGYILLREENEWLKKSVVKAVVLSLVFTFISYAVNLIPSLLGWVSNLIDIFGSPLNYGVVSSIIGLITSGLSIVKVVLFLILAVKALSQSNVSVPVVDSIVNK